MTRCPRRLGLIAALFLLAAAAPCQRAAAQTPPGAPVRNVYDLLGYEYHLTNPPQCTLNVYTVGTTPVRVLTNDPAAVAVTLQNSGTALCTYSYTPQATTKNGIDLGSETAAEEDWKTDLISQTYEHWVVCTGAGNTIVVSRCDLQ